MYLRNLSAAIGLTTAIVAAPAFAADQKRVLTEDELASVNAGIAVYAELFQRNFFASFADDLFGTQPLQSGPCEGCENRIELLNGDKTLFVFKLPRFNLRSRAR